MKLYWYDVLNPRKACAAAKYLGSPVEFVRIDLGKGEHQTKAFRALNPNARLPVLDDDGTIIWEADAIILHLALKAGSGLWPRDARQVDVVRWLSWNHVHFTRYAGAFYFENVIKPRYGLAPDDSGKLDAAATPLRAAASVLDEHLSTRPYVAGDALTIADFSVAATLPYAEQAKLPLGDFPAIWRWHDRLNQLPAWRDPYPAAAP